MRGGLFLLILTPKASSNPKSDHVHMTSFLGNREPLSSEKSLENNWQVCQERGEAIGSQIRAKLRAQPRIN